MMCLLLDAVDCSYVQWIGHRHRQSPIGYCDRKDLMAADQRLGQDFHHFGVDREIPKVDVFDSFRFRDDAREVIFRYEVQTTKDNADLLVRPLLFVESKV